jgi:lysophospholipase L1-like esterase
VRVDNQGAPQNGILPAGYATQALGNVYADPSLRRALANADIGLIDVGFNDTPWARLDDPCEAAPDFPTVQWNQISDECIQRVTHEYKQTLDEMLTQVDQLRAGKPTLLRVVNVYNQVIADVTDPGWKTPQSAHVSRRADSLMASAQCEIAGFHAGSCADVYHAVNGMDGTTPAQPFLVDGTHLNQAGHRLVARTLAHLGYSPLSP